MKAVQLDHMLHGDTAKKRAKVQMSLESYISSPNIPTSVTNIPTSVSSIEHKAIDL